MSFSPTPEQLAIIDADLDSHCVIACPGSGKTATAVRRVLEIRRRLGNARGYVLLLSFSNVAVDTFRSEYDALARQHPGLSNRVRIETIDGLIANFIIRPHGARIMNSSRQPFLVDGSEPFLNNYRIWHDSRPYKISDLAVLPRNGKLIYAIRVNNVSTEVDAAQTRNAISEMAKAGAYTYELGRLWALKLLLAEPGLLAALAKRFPHIIVDEAQDILPLHQLLLKRFKAAGATVSLIGDPNQAIYEFADADGQYLRDVAAAAGDRVFPLSQNRRSLAPIIDVANALAVTKSTPFREPGERAHGAFYVRYDNENIQTGLDLFHSILGKAGYPLDEAALLCRSGEYVSHLSGTGEGMGKGATERFVDAAVLRDLHGDIAKAFECVVSATLKILDNPGNDLKHKLLGNPDDMASRQLRRYLWRFLRDNVHGIPSSTLKAETEWFPKLKTNVAKLLSELEATTAFKRSATVGNNLTKGGLRDTPLCVVDFASEVKNVVRIDTVHQAKGESIPAVMYLARTRDLTQMVAGTQTEVGRVGYVAVTRAKDLFVLGVPASAGKQIVEDIELKGFKLWQ